MSSSARDIRVCGVFAQHCRSKQQTDRPTDRPTVAAEKPHERSVSIAAAAGKRAGIKSLKETTPLWPFKIAHATHPSGVTRPLPRRRIGDGWPPACLAGQSFVPVFAMRNPAKRVKA